MNNEYYTSKITLVTYTVKVHAEKELFVGRIRIRDRLIRIRL